jgi:hypothetical protein
VRRTVLLLALATTFACRDRKSGSAPSHAPARDDGGTGLSGHAAPVDAAVRPGAQAPAPGSWPHVTALSRCVVRMQAAPAAESEAARAVAISRLASLGEDLDIQMSALGDRVGNIDVGEGHAPSKPPRNAADIKALGQALLTTYADVLGLTPDEPGRLHPKVKRLTDSPAIAWEYSARLERSPTGAMPVRTGSGDIFIDFDRRGAVVVVTVDDELLPPITVCPDTLRPEQIEKAVVGRALHWTSDAGRTSEGNVAARDISQTARRIMRIRGEAADGDLVVGAVYQVQIDHEYLPWTMLVDPAAGIVIETRELFDD